MNLGKIGRLYSDSLQRHGPIAKGVGWGDEDSHRLRLHQLSRLIDKSMSTTISVTDLGCGYGSLYDYLRKCGLSIELYRGYDISESMLAEARSRVPADCSQFVLGSKIGEMADYVFASGIFNVRFNADEVEWTQHIISTLDNMYAHAERGMAFNLLSTYVDYREEHLYYADPLLFFDHCKRKYSPYVSLFHDYPLYEWTILVTK